MSPDRRAAADPAELPPGADPRLHQQVHEWLRSYVSEPHTGIGRRGPVCPFVPSALKDHAVQIVVRSTGSRPDEQSVADLLRAAAADFGEIAWPHSNQLLHSLIVVLPDLMHPHEWAVLDEAYASVKSDVVRQGLMIGQFHPACTEPAIRNGAFMVSRAPIALAVIRNMALHDVLFLADRSEWFAEYAARFGHRYRTGRGVDPLFVSVYERAGRSFGATPLREFH